MAKAFEYTWNGGAISKQGRAGAVIGGRKWAELLLSKSRPVTPLDEGTLERSGATSYDERTLTFAVSYDTPYAVVQHEALDYTHAPGREAKYLEKPWAASQQWALPLIAREIRKAMGT